MAFRIISGPEDLICTIFGLLETDINLIKHEEPCTAILRSYRDSSGSSKLNSSQKVSVNHWFFSREILLSGVTDF